MAVVKVTRKGQTTIPKEIRDALGISEGDELMVEVRDGAIVMRPLPRIEELAGKLADYGDVEEIKAKIERMREEYR